MDETSFVEAVATDPDTEIGGRSAPDAQPCLFCGQPEEAELLEIWGPREFMVSTCCEGMHEACVEFLNSDPTAAGRWIGEKLGANTLGLGSVRRVVQLDGQLVLDWNLTINPISLRQAKAFVKLHHAHNPAPAGWRFGASIDNGGERLGVIMIGRPVARMIDHTRIVEVNRLCVRRDLGPELVWNACSMAYGWAARQARALAFDKIITYTRADEDGTSLRAAGWQVDGHTKGRHWDTPSRPRQRSAAPIDKVRWAKSLRKPFKSPQT